MSKNIVFCADGTWQLPVNNTNVYRFFKSLPTTATQVPYYDDGVGAEGSFLERLIGGAAGEGLFEKIRDAYAKIAHVWEPGDEIFLFGFSRGAYTARSLGGMIAVCGLPASSDFSDDVISTAFNAYRNRAARDSLLASLGSSKLTHATIRMVGVWDTVGSLGIPALFGGVDALRFGFLDTSLHPAVKNAFHAMAIDERRHQFPPTLWTTQAPGQNVQQVWFTGCHSDVGGGENADANGTRLSDVTLAWIISKAKQLGLAFDPAVLARYALPLDPKLALCRVHESWSMEWLMPKHRTIDAESVLSDTVAIRCAQDPTYRPPSLYFPNNTLSAEYSLEPVAMPRPQSAGAD